MTTRLTSTPGSGKFGTGQLSLASLSDDYLRLAVRRICYHARDRGVDEVRELLNMLGLDPRLGKMPRPEKNEGERGGT